MTKSNLNSFTGNLISYNQTGIWISGESGIGKTELCLSLLKQGYHFIADDLFQVNEQSLQAYPLDKTPKLSVRGLGIFALKDFLPSEHIAPQTHIKLNLHLVNTPLSQDDYFLKSDFILIGDHQIPKFTLNNLGRSNFSDLVHYFIQSRLK